MKYNYWWSKCLLENVFYSINWTGLILTECEILDYIYVRAVFNAIKFATLNSNKFLAVYHHLEFFRLVFFSMGSMYVHCELWEHETRFEHSCCKQKWMRAMLSMKMSIFKLFVFFSSFSCCWLRSILACDNSVSYIRLCYWKWYIKYEFVLMTFYEEIFSQVCLEYLCSSHAV